MNEFKRKLYLKYRKCDAIFMPQVISIYTSKRTSFFTFVLFFKRTSGLYKKNLSNQLSNSSTNFGPGIKQPEFWTKS